MTMSPRNPSKSFGLKFIPNQLDSFRFIQKSVSKLIQTHPSQFEKKFSISFDANRLKINPMQSEIFIPTENSLRFNLSQTEASNRNKSEVRMIQTEFSIRINPNNFDLGFIRIKASFLYIFF